MLPMTRVGPFWFWVKGSNLEFDFRFVFAFYLQILVRQYINVLIPGVIGDVVSRKKFNLIFH